MSDHAAESSPPPAEEHGLAHVMPVKILVGVFAALIALTVITVGSSYLDFGPYNLLVAMIIAFVKGSLVCMFFMHLWYDSKFNLFIFMSCLAFVVLFISLAMTDTHQYHNSVRGGQAPNVPAATYGEAPPAAKP